MTPERYADMIGKRQAYANEIALGTTVDPLGILRLLDEAMEAYEDALIGLRRQRLAGERFLVEVMREEGTRAPRKGVTT